MCPRLRISDTSPPALSSKLLSVARVELAGDAGDQTRSCVDFVPTLRPVQGGQESWAARESSRKCLGSLHARAGGVCSSAVAVNGRRSPTSRVVGFETSPALQSCFRVMTWQCSFICTQSLRSMACTATFLGLLDLTKADVRALTTRQHRGLPAHPPCHLDQLSPNAVRLDSVSPLSSASGYSAHP